VGGEQSRFARSVLTAGADLCGRHRVWPSASTFWGVAQHVWPTPGLPNGGLAIRAYPFWGDSSVQIFLFGQLVLAPASVEPRRERVALDALRVIWIPLGTGSICLTLLPYSLTSFIPRSRSLALPSLSAVNPPRIGRANLPCRQRPGEHVPGPVLDRPMIGAYASLPCARGRSFPTSGVGFLFHRTHSPPPPTSASTSFLPSRLPPLCPHSLQLGHRWSRAQVSG